MAADPLDALRLPVVPIDPRPEFAAALLRRITSAAEGRPDAAGQPDIAGQPDTAGRRAAVGRPGGVRLRRNPTVRYFVRDLDAAVAFYCQRLGFEEELRSAPAFAMLYGGGLRLLLSVPGQPGAGRPLPDGTMPEAGGWNRITLQVPDVTEAIRELRTAGVRIRADVGSGVAVRQALVEDPDGNLVELYEPTAGYHERTEES
jgi:catechol 2,3-dioxygenase-like lactoylglutathione lyase family enzyme